MFRIGTVKFVTVKERNIEVRINSHGHGTIAGIVSCRDEEKVMGLLYSGQIRSCNNGVLLLDALICLAYS